jgi:hypothetical protein
MLGRWVSAVRRNHALEHATVAVLLARHGPMRIAGRASTDGFLLFSELDSAEILDAAHEALRRLRAGEAGLAVSPLCGTNVAVAGAVAASAAIGALAASRRSGRWANAFLAAMVGVIASQPLGRAVQEHLTTRPDLEAVEVLDAQPVAGLLRKVRTRGAIA